MNTLEFFADINSQVGHQLLSYGNMTDQLESAAHELDLTRDRIHTNNDNCVGFSLRGDEGDLYEFVGRAENILGKDFQLLQSALRRSNVVEAEQVDFEQFGNQFAVQDD